MTLAIVTTMRNNEQSESIRNVLAAGWKKCTKTVARLLNRPTSSLVMPCDILAHGVVPFIATQNLEGIRALAKISRVNKKMRQKIIQTEGWNDLVNEACKRQALSKKLLG